MSAIIVDSMCIHLLRCDAAVDARSGMASADSIPTTKVTIISEAWPMGAAEITGLVVKTASLASSSLGVQIRWRQWRRQIIFRDVYFAVAAGAG